MHWCFYFYWRLAVGINEVNLWQVCVYMCLCDFSVNRQMNGNKMKLSFVAKTYQTDAAYSLYQTCFAACFTMITKH